MNSKKIAFLGCGNMGAALLRAMHESLSPRPEFFIYDSDPAKTAVLASLGSISVCKDARECAQKADLIFLCVKPQGMAAALEPLKNLSAEKIYISIAAGLKIEKFKNWLGSQRIVRVMPNTPAMVRSGAGAASFSGNISQDEQALILEMLRTTGAMHTVEENLIDAVTAVSGSGPAYVFQFLIELARAGEIAGLEKSMAEDLAKRTVFGAMKLLLETGKDPETLRKEVTSPGGTTQAGLESLTRDNFSKVIENCVLSAHKRAKELGG